MSGSPESSKKPLHPEGKKATPYWEVMKFIGQGGIETKETLDAGLVIVQHTPEGDIPSQIGEVDEHDDRPVKSEEKEERFAQLSPEAQALYFRLKKEGRI